MKNYYHKYFEDYEEERVPNRDGKGTHIEHKYVGYYYRLGVKRITRIALRLLYLVLGCLAAACLLFGAARMAHCNTLPVMVILQAVTLLLLIWFVWVLLYYIFVPENMTSYKYKSTALQMLKVCKWLSVVFFLDAASVLADILINKNTAQEQIICLAAYIAGGMVAVILRTVERALPYERLSNDKEITWYREKNGWR